MEVLRIENLKIWQSFSTNSLSFLMNTFLFLLIEQKSKTSLEAAIQMCSLKNVFIEKNNKVVKILEMQL